MSCTPRASRSRTRAQLARERFGVEGAVSELGSHQDQNVLVDTGSARFVLKIANAAFGEAELDLQNRAMVHLAERLPFEVPLPCAALDGSELVAVERDGVTYLLRLVTFIEGEPLIDARPPRAARAPLARRGRGPGRALARGLRARGRRPRDAVGSAPRRRGRRGARARTSRIRAGASSSPESAQAAAEAVERLARACRARSCTAT